VESLEKEGAIPTAILNALKSLGLQGNYGRRSVSNEVKALRFSKTFPDLNVRMLTPLYWEIMLENQVEALTITAHKPILLTGFTLGCDAKTKTVYIERAYITEGSDTAGTVLWSGLNKTWLVCDIDVPG
jgi:hypothetical protein